jgi:selenocysteine lyase/cysteine desulfurase
MNDFKSFYSHFLSQQKDTLHFAAHSHHFWPDASRLGHMQCWEDAALMNDSKWSHIFANVIPKVQSHLAKMLHLKKPEMIALAPNTHDLLVRLFSELLLKKDLKILTTDSEFHSFSRQLQRWQEVYPDLQVTKKVALDLLSDRESWVKDFVTKSQDADVIFLSHVFFNSGIALSLDELHEIALSAPKDCVVIIDGYHGTGAIETDLSRLEDRIFYLGGGYKYLQAGEGVGFMLTPSGKHRPVITGWFSEFGELSKPRSGEVAYASDAMKFWGATLDPSGWYRFNAVWDFFESIHLDIASIHTYVRSLQTYFLEELGTKSLLQKCRPLFELPLSNHGHFLTFKAPSATEANRLFLEFQKRGIVIDQRGDRLRFGFGLYQGRTDVLELTKRLSLSN